MRFAFDPIQSSRTVDTVVERIQGRILDRTLAEGSKLPSEEQLATQLQVGRRSVREAFRVLETKGLIEIQMGVGAFVRRNDLDIFLESLSSNVRSYLRTDRASAKHVNQLRRLLEGAALAQLATTSNGDSIQQLTEAVARMQEAYDAQDPSAYQNWHFRFHNSIVGTLQNPIIAMIYEQVLSLMRLPMERSGSDRDIMAEAIGEHSRIVDALRRRAIEDVHAELDTHLAHFVAHMELEIGQNDEKAENPS